MPQLAGQGNRDGARFQVGYFHGFVLVDICLRDRLG